MAGSVTTRPVGEYHKFFKQANNLVKNDNLLTRREIKEQLNLLDIDRQAAFIGGGNSPQYKAIMAQIDVGNTMLKYFDKFAAKSGSKNAINAKGIDRIAAVDGNAKDVSAKDFKK